MCLLRLGGTTSTAHFVALSCGGNCRPRSSLTRPPIIKPGDDERLGDDGSNREVTEAGKIGQPHPDDERHQAQSCENDGAATVLWVSARALRRQCRPLTLHNEL